MCINRPGAALGCKSLAGRPALFASALHTASSTGQKNLLWRYSALQACTALRVVTRAPLQRRRRSGLRRISRRGPHQKAKFLGQA